MPLSRYLRIWPSKEVESSFHLYSTKKGSLIRVSGALLVAARNEALTEAERETLARLEIWTDNPALEREEMRSMVSRTNERRNRFNAIVVLNLDCNLACPYCYEGPFRGKHYMSAGTAALLVETVIREQISLGREVSLDFYGGEPLLTVPRLKEIAIPIQAAAREHGTKFSFFLFTNGTLLNRQLVEQLVPLGLTGALLTLDGPREIHDCQRPFVSGRGSFDLIVTNVKSVCDLIEIQIGGNYTAENYLEFPRMLDHLLTEGIMPKRLKLVQFSPVGEKSSSSALRDGHGACAPASDECVMAAAPYLLEETLKRGFPAPKPTMGACMVEFENSLVINYDGSLYKCPAFMGWPELAVGTLTDGVKNYSVSHNLSHWQTDECLECSYLPLCFGGCRLNPLLKNDAINEVDCRKPFFDANLQEIVLLERRYGNQKGSSPVSCEAIYT